MKLTMYCNGTDEPLCTCEGGPSGRVDDIDPDLAYATISPNVLVLETDDRGRGIDVNINGVDVEPASTDTPRTMPATRQVPPPPYLGEEQRTHPEENHLTNDVAVALFPSPPSMDQDNDGLMVLDPGQQEGAYVLAGQAATRGDGARTTNADEAPRLGQEAGAVRRSVRIRLDLKVTTTTRVG